MEGGAENGAEKKGRGGARPGAGRKKLSAEEKSKNYTVSLSPAQRTILKGAVEELESTPYALLQAWTSAAIDDLGDPKRREKALAIARKRIKKKQGSDDDGSA